MRFSRSTGSVVATVAVLVAAGMALAAVTLQRVKGDLVATDESVETEGRFKVVSLVRNSELHERLYVRARKFDVTADENGDLPLLSLWLIDSEGTEAAMGDLRRSKSGRARFSFRSRRDAYPEGVGALRDFGGGSIEIRMADGSVALSGDVPEFVDLDDEVGEDSGAAAFGFASSQLASGDDDSDLRGRVLLQRANSSRGMFEALSVSAHGLDSESGDHSVVAIDGEGAKTELGSLRARGRRGFGLLTLSTRRDDTIPGGVDGLAGSTLEIRDSAGVVVLSGVVPTIE